MTVTALKPFVAASLGLSMFVTCLESAARAQSAERATAEAASAQAQPKEKTPPQPMIQAQNKPRATQRVRSEAPRGEPARRDNVVDGAATTIRLNHTPAVDAAQTLNEFLTASGLVEAVVVVPNAIGNTLLVRATDERTKEIERMVEQLDRLSPMVQIRALIAEVHGDAPRGGESASDDEPGDAAAAKDSPAQPSSGVRIGRNRRSPASLGAADGDRLLSVLDALEGTESLQHQIRVLEKSGRLEVLARPQIMTLDNQPAFIHVGKRVPRISGIRTDGRNRTNQVELENVGLKLGVTPRVSDQGIILMEIDLEISDVRDHEDVVLASIDEGPVIPASEVMIATAQSTVSVASGKTIVLGGMSTRSKRQHVEMVILVSATIVSLDGK